MDKYIYIYIYLYIFIRIFPHTHAHIYVRLPTIISIYLSYYMLESIHAFILLEIETFLDCIHIFISSCMHICCPVGSFCRIHRLHLCREVRPPPQRVSGMYDTKQSDRAVPAMLELWEMQSTPSLPSFPGPLWPSVVAPDRALSMG